MEKQSFDEAYNRCAGSYQNTKSVDLIQTNYTKNDSTTSVSIIKSIAPAVDESACTFRNAQQIVRASTRTIVPSNSLIDIPILIRQRDQLSNNLNFESFYGLGRTEGLSAHIVDNNWNFVQVKNATNSPVTIQRHARLGKIVAFDWRNSQSTTSEKEEEFTSKEEREVSSQIKHR